jgi:hypothetical protein
MGQAIEKSRLPATSTAAAKQALRQQLQELTERQPVHLHAQSIARLVANHADARIQVLEPGFRTPPPLYNCVMYALDLVDRFEPSLRHLHGLDFRFLADTGFLQLALARDVIRNELPLTQAGQGDLVVYFQGGHPRHAAKHLGAGLYTSKWGPGGLYAHGLWDLPLNLGSGAHAFRAPSPHAVLELLFECEPDLRLKAHQVAPPQPPGPPSENPRVAAPTAL